MQIIVQKFGGTSLSTPEKREKAVQRILEAKQKGYRPVVVVSAMGRKGDPYATDTFIQLANEVYPETSPRELDLLASCGEIISAVIMANTLIKNGLRALVLTGAQAGIITDDNFNDARILRVEPEAVLRHLQEDNVVVVTGFQGISESKDITTLGRGGSDTTAAALAAALKAEVVEIYTDVEGIKTADPRIVPDARTLPAVTYEEIVQMAREGAKVVHPRSVEIAMRAAIPLRVRSTCDDGEGTLVTFGPVPAGSGEGRLITGVAQIEGVSQLVVTPSAEMANSDCDLLLFSSLADAQVSVDLINVFPDRKSFLVKGELAAKAKETLERQGFQVENRNSCAKVSVIGIRMHGRPGVMARVAKALNQVGVQILATADSHMTISCLVREEDMQKAVRALHQEFGL